MKRFRRPAPAVIAFYLILTLAACNLPQETPLPNGGAPPPASPVEPTLAAATPIGAATEQTQENTPPPTTEPGNITDRPPLTDFKRIDEQNGWGLGGQLVWRTTDGAAHWQDVTPQGYGGQGEDGTGFFLDANTAWVLLPTADASSGLLYQTTDGGQSWRNFPTPFSAGQLFFLDSQAGWALSISSAGAGSAEADVYQTSDGGAIWAEVYKMNPSKPKAKGGLPLSGMKNGISFRDATHGWVTGSVPVDSYAWLFASADGGRTWQHQDLVTPVDEQSHQLNIDPPLFFGTQDGLLPVGLITDTVHWDFFVTHDGGASWTSTSLSPGSGHYDFATLQDGFIWDAAALYVTHDSGVSWTAVKPNLDLSQALVKLDFVTARLGWALALDANGDSRLYKTTDGGATWKP